MKFVNRFFLLFISVFFMQKAYTQSIPVGTVGDDYFRILQLQGKIDPKYSYSTRPNFLTNKFPIDSFYHLIDSNLNTNIALKSRFVEFRPMLVQLRSQYNSLHPYGWNDEGMIKAKGIQTMARVGVYTRIGPLHIQFMPEHVNAENAPYEISDEFGSIPKDRFQQNFLGQSSVRLNLSAVSIGFSNENIYWGPGQYGALIMSNNAPGFANIFIKTHRPAKTPIGNFEFELIGGRLESDSLLPYENFHLKSSPNLRNSWRYINAYILSYNPKWLPGVYVGLIRSLQKYGPGIAEGKGSFTNKYIPIVTKTFQKKNDWGDDTLSIDQVASFFVRIVFPKSKSELYVEYGKNDYGERTRDYLMAPTHSVAHIVGFKKIVTLNKNKTTAKRVKVN